MNFGRLEAAFHAFNRREKILFWFSVALLTIGLLWQASAFYVRNTIVEPARGGVWREGVVGTARVINPVLGDTGEGDRVMKTLLFAGLFKVDNQGGVIPDLAGSYELSHDGKTYLVTLKPNLVWHDGKPLTADDVLFTIDLIKNPELRNPLAENWQGVTADKISDATIRFVLPAPYPLFLNNLTFGIIPEHLWSSVLPQNLPFSDLNTRPIGAGPYRFKYLQQGANGVITQYTLVANQNYPGPGPYIDTVIVRFFPTYNDAIAALKKKEIDGLGGIPAGNVKALADTGSLRVLRPLVPRYFAVFFNSNSLLFRDERVREALVRATDKERIVRNALSGQAEVVSSPIVPGLPGAEATTNLFDPNQAKALLSADGWHMPHGGQVLEKKLSPRDRSTTKLEFDLLLPDSTELQSVAGILRDNWQAIGVNVNIKSVSVSEFTSTLQSRSYQAMLFGEVFATGRDVDPFPFWHSSQKSPPGLNLSLYSNQKVDQVLEKIRREQDGGRRIALLGQFQTALLNDFPALFLYSQDYVYALSPVVHTPNLAFLSSAEERLSRINEWFLNTRRAWKS